MIATDSKGEVKFHMIYDEWGVPQVNTRLDMNYHGLDNINNYTGYSYDEVLNIYFAQNRFYDPQNRRFIKEDPIKNGQNWYAYCDSNPATNMDLLGFYYIQAKFNNNKNTLDGIGRLLEQSALLVW